MDGQSLARKVLGALADNSGIYMPIGRVPPAPASYVGEDVMRSARGYVRPPVGSETGLIDPYALIASSYPAHLRDRALARLADSQMQREPPAGRDWHAIVIRPSAEVSPGMAGRFSSSTYPDGATSTAIDLAGLSGDALRTLIHESRHATELPQHLDKRARTSVAAIPRINGLTRALKPHYRKYLAQPSEMLAYLGEAGDDFVQANNRLVQSDYDAATVMDMIESGDALSRVNDAYRRHYVQAYKSNPAARKNMNDVLMRYFAVPGAVGAWSAMQEE